MTTVQAAIRGQMGSVRYYMAKMNAREFVSQTRAAKDIDGWANFGIEERMQRDLAWVRIRNEIVPYLTRSEDRFFGAFVVLVYRGKMHFESVSEIVTNYLQNVAEVDLNAKFLPPAYELAFADTGVLTINGGELIILDGQHRWRAIKAAVERDEEVPPENFGQYTSAVGADELEVVFIEFDGNEHDRSSQKIRRIFNKLNRHAKPTGRSDDIITSEDDGYAILARRLLRNGEPLVQDVELKKRGVIATEKIVNWKSTTIAARSTSFTTISAVYETAKTAGRVYGVDPDRWNEKKNAVRPEDDELDAVYAVLSEWWDTLLKGVTVFTAALEDPKRLPELRAPGQPYSLLFKPAAHIILFKALELAVSRGLDLSEAVERINRIDWNVESEHWRDILIQPSGRISARQEHYKVTAELVAYLISADLMSAEDVSQVLESIRKFQSEVVSLPKPVVMADLLLDTAVHALPHEYVRPGSRARPGYQRSEVDMDEILDSEERRAVPWRYPRDDDADVVDPVTEMEGQQ
jgi:DNA sulfur modification protein DndB